jgi:hypothetical protein
LLIAAPSFGQMKTNNDFIYSAVQENNGWITVLLPTGRVGMDGQLSFYGHSYFSCKISGEVFTNNDVAVKPSDAGSGWQLSDGNTTKVQDTVRTVWTRNNVDIIQEVFPVAIGDAGQVAMRWSFKNHSTIAVTASCQFLLDISIADPMDKVNPNSTDCPSLYFPNAGFSNNWQQYLSPNIPSFFLGFLRFPSSSPGVSFQGNLSDPDLSPVAPSRVTYGDWNTLSASAFGVNPIIGGPIGSDGGLLIEFSEKVVAPNESIVIGTTSYGMGAFQLCNGPLPGILKYPGKLVWNKSKGAFDPSSFTIEFHLLNLNTAVALNTSVTANLGSGLLFQGGGKTRSKGPFTIASGGEQSFSWDVTVLPIDPCPGQFLSFVSFTGQSSLAASNFEADTCLHPIVMACEESLSTPVADVKGPALEVSIVPNPITDQLQVSVKNAAHPLTIELIDLLGKVTMLPSSDGFSLSTKQLGLAPGVYVLSVSDGEQTITRNIVKE